MGELEQSMRDRDLLHPLHSHKSLLRSCLVRCQPADHSCLTSGPDCPRVNACTHISSTLEALHSRAYQEGSVPQSAP